MEFDGRPGQVPIAVVGLAAFMPGSTDASGFWRNVLTGRDLMTDVPPSRWLVGDHYDPDQRAADKTYGRRGAFLPHVDFDPVRYGIPPNSLPAIDTSQLLALMVADRVIADCAVGLPADRERVSVLLGVAPLQMIVEAASRLDRPVWRKALREHGIGSAEADAICDAIAGHFVPWQEETFPGLLSNVVSGRIANKFDLHGVNHTTDAACASSLAALYSAVGDLSLRRSDLVITGGVDTANDILMYKCFSSTPALSPTGDCRPFSAAADGTMLGEGVVMFALKRLADAERDGDRVHAVIRGVGASSDGRGTAIYAPLPAGQVRALRRAYEQAGYGPETVELVEAHGTGTTAGDAAEFAALREVFDGAGRADRQWCALGSVKSQVGHTKATAGAAGMLKAVLALRQKVLPPTIKVAKPHPGLGLDASPFYLATAPRPWIRPRAEADHPRRASVSSFGFGGTNFHVAIEEYVPGPASAATPAGHLHAAPAELIMLSAPSPAELLERAREVDLGQPLPELARQAAAEFSPEHDARLAIVAADADDLSAKILTAAGRIESGQLETGPLPPRGQVSYGVYYGAGRPAPGLTAFLFPGQGAQYVGMGADLAMHLPLARAVWDDAARHELGDRPLHRVVFPPPVFGDDGRASQQALLTATEWAQPALGAQSMALLAALSSLGLRPDCVAGHSFGELVALHAAGAFDAGTLLRLARRRGELMRDAAAVRGVMLAVTAGLDRAEKAIAGLPDVWLANDNSPKQVVFSGTREAIDAAEARLAADGITFVRLQAATGFHSPLVAQAAEPFAEFLEEAEIRSPVLAVYAGRDGEVYQADAAAVRRGLAAQIAAPVRFADVIEAMYDQGARTFIEVGAGSTLSGLVGQILGEREHAAVSLDRKGRHGLTSLLDGLGRLAVRGLELNLAALYAPAGDRQPAERLSKATVRIDGGNYGRPYPANAAAPPPGVNGHGSAVPGVNGQGSPAPVVATQNGHPAALKPAPRVDPPPMSVRVNGTGHAPPLAPKPIQASPAPPTLALPAPTPLEPAAPMTEPDPHAPDPQAPDPNTQWLAAVREMQRQTAEAHMHFQRVLADSHLAFLQMAENTFAAFTGQPQPSPQRVPAPAPTPPAPAPTPPAPAPMPPAPAPTPSAPEPRAFPAPEPRAFPAMVAEPPIAPQHIPGPVPVEPAATTEPVSLALLLSIVADKTGYPVDMLNGGMDLETDLGIDSIKKVEIFAAVRQRAEGLPATDSPQMAQLFQARTLDEVMRKATDNSAVPAVGGTVPDTDTGEQRPAVTGEQRPAVDAGEHGPVLVRRLQVRPIAAPACGLALAGLANGPITVVDGGSGLAPAVVAQFDAHGITATVGDMPVRDAWGVILLGGLAPVSGPEQAGSVSRAAFQAARDVAASMEERGGVFVTVQDTGGCFGLKDPDSRRAWLGGLAALTRTAAKEWPLAAVKAIDCQRGDRGSAAVAAAIVSELLTGGCTLEVGLRADGTRWALADSEPAPAPPLEAPVTPDSVLVVSGGARGVTAAALLSLASACQPRMLLIGRTALADEPEFLASARDQPALTRLLAERGSANDTPARVATEARTILARREVRATLADLEQAGATVRYAALDITDREALSRELARVRQEWGPITGLVHGAGVLADKLIADKTDDQFDRVYDTKVAGLAALLDACASDPLDLLCVFSSVAARYGNPGQCDYAMANEVLNQVASAERHRRPSSRVRALGWGPWEAGMVTASHAAHFTSLGVPLIPLAAGAQAFVAELGTADDAASVLLAAAPERDGDLLASGPSRVVVDATVNARTHGFLADHAPADVPVLPLAMAMEWFASAGRARYPHRSTSLSDIRVLNRIELPGLAARDHRFTIEGTEASRDPDALDLRLTSSTSAAHYRARLVAPNAPPHSWTTLGAMGEPFTEPIYDAAVLFHGPEFRVLRQVESMSRHGAEARIVGVRAIGWPGGPWWTDPAAIDGALQAAVLWARHANGDATLPMGMDALRVHRAGPAPGTLRCLVRATSIAADQTRCDIALLDEDGEIRTELLGVSLIRRPDMASAPSARASDTVAVVATAAPARPV